MRAAAPRLKPGAAASGPPPLSASRKRSFAERKKDNRSCTHTTVKCCFKKAIASRPNACLAAVSDGGWLADSGVRPRRLDPVPSAERVFEVIRPLVETVTRAARRGSLLAGLVLLVELSNGGGRLDDEALGGGKNNSFMGQCFTAGSFVTRGRSPQLDVSDPRVDNAAKLFNSLLMPFAYTRRQGDRQAIQAAANEHWTSFRNHFEVNLEARLVRYIKTVVRRYCPNGRAPRSDFQKALRYVTRPQEGDVVPELSEAFHEIAWRRLAELRSRALEASVPQGGDGVTPALAKHRALLRLVELTYWILQQVEEMGGKPFCMFPLCGHQMRHVAVDQRVFSDYIYPRLVNGGFYQDPGPSDSLKADAMWSLIPGAWNLRGVEWSPASCFKTDGYSLCVTLQKPGAPPKNRDKKKELVERLVPAGAVRVGIDMGLKTIFHAVWRDSDGVWKEKTLSRTEYYKEANHQAHAAIVRRREKKLADCTEELSLCRRRTSRLEDLRQYILTAGSFEARCWEVRGDFRLARSRMAVYMRRVGCLDRWVNSLVRDVKHDRPEAATVAACVGFPSFNSCTRGCKAAPTTLAYKRLALLTYVVPVDEYRTSKVCYVCQGDLRPACMFDRRKGRVTEVRSVRLCSSTVCRELQASRGYFYGWLATQWGGSVRYSRDKNSAKHHHDLGGLMNAERPEALRR